MFVSIQLCDKIVIDFVYKLLKRWIFIVFHLTDAFYILVYFGYQLSFVQSMNILDFLN
jgi:hypothetical protein